MSCNLQNGEKLSPFKVERQCIENGELLFRSSSFRELLSLLTDFKIPQYIIHEGQKKKKKKDLGWLSKTTFHFDVVDAVTRLEIILTMDYSVFNSIYYYYF